MKKISAGWWVVIILYAISVIATVITHSMLFTRYSYDNIVVTCIDKRVETTNGYNNSYDTVYFDFTASNEGVCSASMLKGNVKIVDHSTQTTLLEKEYNLNNIYAGENENFYISFSNSRNQVENFEELYNTDYSNLDVSCEIISAEFTESNLLFSAIKTIAPIPTYLIGVLLAGILMIFGPIFIYAGGEKIENTILKAIYIIVLLPLWVLGWCITLGGKKEKKGIWIFIPKE